MRRKSCSLPGQARDVVGVVAHSDWPPDARAVPNVGDANALDLERIVALKPDLVVAWPYTMPAQLAALQSRGTTIFVSDPKSIAGIARDVEALGTLAGTDPTARAAATKLRDALRGADHKICGRAGRFRVLRSVERSVADNRRTTLDFGGYRTVRRDQCVRCVDASCADGFIGSRGGSWARSYHCRK